MFIWCLKITHASELIYKRYILMNIFFINAKRVHLYSSDSNLDCIQTLIPTIYGPIFWRSQNAIIKYSLWQWQLLSKFTFPSHQIPHKSDYRTFSNTNPVELLRKGFPKNCSCTIKCIYQTSLLKFINRKYEGAYLFIV